DQTILGTKMQYAQFVVIRFPFGHEIHHGGNLDHAPCADDVREMLPQIGSVGMLPAGPAAALRETEVRVARAVQPRVCRKNSAPEFAELHVKRLDPANATATQYFAKMLARFAHDVVVAAEK